MEQTQTKNNRIYYPALYKERERQRIEEWCDWLQSDRVRGERARLRRCQTPREVLTQKSFFKLGKDLPWWQKYHLLGLATVAGTLAHVENNKIDLSLSGQLGSAKLGMDKPIFSELRFQKLLASSDAEALYKNLYRAVKQVNKQVNPVLLADSILHWHLEQITPEKFQGSKNWKYRCANDYYNSTVFK